MKPRLLIFNLFVFSLTSSTSFAQIFKDPKEVLKQKSTNRAENRANRTVDQGLDKVEEGIGNLFKKKKKENQEENQSEANPNEASQNQDVNQNDGRKGSGTPTSAPKAETLKSYSKFDFVPGEKVVATEDFSQDAVGDFPAKWNTNATAEVVTLSGKPGKWLKFGKVQGSFIPEFIKNIPDNATIEFDLVYNDWMPRYSYARRLHVALASVEKQGKNMADASVGEGAMFTFDGDMGKGKVELRQLEKNGGFTDLHGQKGMDAYINENNNGKVFKVSMWRQKTRLRVYVDELKVFDMPRIFSPDLKLNELRFFAYIENEGEELFLSNIRMAVGAPDTRNKLITEGKFVTTGITFDVGSANIKPTSYGVLKEIGTALSENPDVKIRIVGHTDSDGDAAKNTELSKNRAESVKKALTSEFGIDASRMQTDGKGASQPAQPNSTPEGKANNRRVEFLKI